MGTATSVSHTDAAGVDDHSATHEAGEWHVSMAADDGFDFGGDSGEDFVPARIGGVDQDDVVVGARSCVTEQGWAEAFYCQVQRQRQGFEDGDILIRDGLRGEFRDGVWHFGAAAAPVFDQFAIGVANEPFHAVTEGEQAVHDLVRLRAGGDVAQGDDAVGGADCGVREDGIEGGEDAVDVGEDGDFHEGVRWVLVGGSGVND